jgi:tryptophan synthase alpha chain
MKTLEATLRAIRGDGRKALVPYFMAGVTPNWTEFIEAAIQGGADAIEIGLPFSDPLMDGVVIQQAGLRALETGTTFSSVCATLSQQSFSVPLIAMTYYNLFHHDGVERAAGRLHESGISGAIVPDLTLEESADWRSVCDDSDIATIFMVAPSTTMDRFEALAAATEGFCYAAARMAVTGRAAGAGDAERVVASVRDVSDVPTYVGIGITKPDQARESASFSDGVIVGSAIVERVLAGDSPVEIERQVASFRRAIDG